MWRTNSDVWAATARLIPGEHRCRFYSGDDRSVFYHGPASIDGSTEDGMDAVVSVQLVRGKMALNPISILLVDDDPTTLSAFEKLLRAEGHVVHIAEGYQTALDVTKRERIDLAVCDINLWDGDGCDLLKELQKIKAMKGIAITGYTLPEEIEHYRESGFGVVLRKPVDHSQMTSAIAELSYEATIG
jgi:CheY-like chemotaxis protein